MSFRSGAERACFSCVFLLEYSIRNMNGAHTAINCWATDQCLAIGKVGYPNIELPENAMKRTHSANYALNKKIAHRLWNGLSLAALQQLRQLTIDHKLSIASGELILLDGRWYVTHAGLLGIARRKKCDGIHVEAVPALSDATANRFVLKAMVYPSKSSVGFVGYGDADPSNVSPLVRGAEMRVAETRAVNRALRKAYGIGICSVEEIGSSIPSSAEKIPPQNANGNGNGSSPKVRDRLCQIIRQHKLDPELVKSYAVDFCGTKTLREATREQVENFVQQLADWAEKDRNALLCQLNSYARPKQEVVA